MTSKDISMAKAILSNSSFSDLVLRSDDENGRETRELTGGAEQFAE